MSFCAGLRLCPVLAEAFCLKPRDRRAQDGGRSVYGAQFVVRDHRWDQEKGTDAKLAIADRDPASDHREDGEAIAAIGMAGLVEDDFFDAEIFAL